MGRHLQITEALEEMNLERCCECNLSWVRGIESDEATMVTGALSRVTKDISVNLTRAEMSPDVAQIFADLALTSQNIVEMNLEGNDIGGRAEGGLVLRALRGASGLRTLNLAHNKLGNDGVPALVELLANNRSLRSLGLESNGLQGCAVVSIASAIQENCALEELFLTGNMLGDEGVGAVAGMLSNSTLQELYLDCCGIEDEGAEDLAAYMACGGSALRRLWLCNNEIGSRGFLALAQLLQEPACTLKDLSLHRNPVGTLGLTRLVETLRDYPNTGLRRLDISGIKLRPAELELICSTADTNYTLEALEIDGKCFPECESQIGVSLARNAALAQLLPLYRRLAFASAMHQRLGATSVLRFLPRREDFGGDLHDMIMSQLAWWQHHSSSPAAVYHGGGGHGEVMARFGRQQQRRWVSDYK